MSKTLGIYLESIYGLILTVNNQDPWICLGVNCKYVDWYTSWSDLGYDKPHIDDVHLGVIIIWFVNID